MSIATTEGNATSAPKADTGPISPRLFNTGSLRLLTATGVSLYGDWLSTVALVVLLFRLTNSPSAPALYILVRNAPRLLGSIPGGALADRFGLARFASISALVQGALTAAVVPLANAHVLPLIYVAVGLSQFVFGMSQPAQNSLVPSVVTRKHLARMNGLTNGLLSTAILIAPAIGALLLLRVAPTTLIVADAASFGLAAILLFTLRTARSSVPAAAAVPHGAAAGIRIVFGDAVFRAVALGYMGNAAVVTGLQAVLVVAAADRFGGDTTVGWLYAAVGAGALVGSLLVIQRSPSNIQRRAIVTATVLELTPLVAFVFVRALPFAIVLLFFSSFGAILYQTQGAIAVQERVSGDLLGRVNAAVRFSQYTGMLIGSITAVTLVQFLGWPQTVLILATFSVVLILIALLLPVSRSAAGAPARSGGG